MDNQKREMTNEGPASDPTSDPTIDSTMIYKQERE